MPFQSVPNTAEAVVIWTANLQRCTMTFHFTLATGYDQADIDQLALSMDVWAVNEFVPLISNQVTYEGIEVRGLESSVDLFGSVTTNAQVGTINGAPTPNSVTLAVKRTTGFTGRSARGRVYFPCNAPSIDTDENFMNAGWSGNVVDALEEVIEVDGGTGWTHVVVSRQNGGVILNPAVTRAVVAYSLTDREIDSQQRRMPSK